MCLSSRQALGALLAVVVLCIISVNPVVAATLAQQDIQNIAQQNIARKANQGSAPPRNITAALNKHANVSASTIANAQAIVADAIAACAILNKARVENPLGNVYTLQPEDAAAARRAAPPLFEVTPEIAAAAALLAEIDAAAAYKNGTLYQDYSANAALRKREKVEERTASSYWMAQLDDLGTMPFGGNASYRVFRNVNDTRYAGGAQGDGVTDDTAAINAAIQDGNRCGANCYGSTTTAAPTNPPVIVAGAQFVGLGVINTDFYYADGGIGIDGLSREWYINTANFYRQIRNFVIDIRASSQTAYVAALHYQVAQATSLYNVDFVVSSQSGTNQQAIFTENGSGGFMSDLTFTGGAFGIYGGNQQFTATGLSFSGCGTAIQLIWDWGWIWKDLSISNCGIGISMLSADGVHRTGSLLVQDSSFSNTPSAIVIFPPVAVEESGTTGITLDNVIFSGVTSAVVDNAGTTWLPGSVNSVDTWTLGPSFIQAANGTYTLGTTSKTPRIASLTASSVSGYPKARYYTQNKPQYAGAVVVQMKWFCYGDGVHDDTANFQEVIDLFAGPAYLIFIDAGSYILSDTITIPSGARIVGQCWSQLVASGANFDDPSNPHVLFRVGAQGGQVGNVQIQDLLFTTIGTTAGLIAVEWNMEADAQGSAAMWDCHVRIGGAKGTNLQAANCPAVHSGIDSSCISGSMMFHMTPTGSGYIENMWLWTADHDIDDANMTQTSVYVARGILIESVNPLWLYGTASEHATFYQYEFYQAANVYAGMIQTESPYYQPTPQPPAPFASDVGVFPGDPAFLCTNGGEGCDASWAVRMVESSNITISGAGLYSWFDTYVETCVDTQNCQISLIDMENNNNGIYIYNLITIGALNMISTDAQNFHSEISALNYTNVDYHPYWSQISLYEPPPVPNDGGDGGNIIYVPTTVWSSGGASTASCSNAPCTLVIPPSPLHSTSTITWPALTTTLLVSKGGKISTTTTTITVAPFTITAIPFWPVTVYPTDPASATFSPVQSVMPPSFVITLPGSIATFPPTPFPVYSSGTPVSSLSSSTGTGAYASLFFPTSHGVTVQPQPTILITLPTPTPVVETIPATTTTFSSTPITYTPSTTTSTPVVGILTYTSAKPTSTCSGPFCGWYFCEIFGCGGGCGEYACNGGCGILGCGFGCGLWGCGSDCIPFFGCPGGQCPLFICGGVGCENGGCGGEPEGECQEVFANHCTVVISSTLTATPSKYSTSTGTQCISVQSCSAKDSTTTTTVTGTDPTYGLITPLSDEQFSTAPASVFASVASGVLLSQYDWDLTRFGVYYPYTFTDSSGNIIECLSEAGTKCAGSSSTIFTAATKLSPTTTSSTAISTSTFPPALSPNIIWCYIELFNCANDPCTVSSAQYLWFEDDGDSTCLFPGILYGSTESVVGPTAELDSTYHFPTTQTVPMGTKVSELNCLFYPNYYDGTAAGADNYYGPLPENYDIGTWSCSPGTTYKSSTAVKMGNCYKSYDDAGVINTGSVSATYTLYFCRSELNPYPSS